MCQAKPGPRCSAHQEQSLRRALERVAYFQDTGINENNEKQYNKSVEELYYNFIEWCATPAGRNLEMNRRTMTEDVKERRILLDQEKEGDRLRESRVNAVKNGTEPNEIKPFSTTRANIIRTLSAHSWYATYFANQDKFDNDQTEKVNITLKKKKVYIHLKLVHLF
jgi:hypothetical protein